MSFSMASIAVTSWLRTGAGAVGSCGSGSEQSGHSQRAVAARVGGGEERHGTCQGVLHVTQRSLSSSPGTALHTIHAPSLSHGS